MQACGDTKASKNLSPSAIRPALCTLSKLSINSCTKPRNQIGKTGLKKPLDNLIHAFVITPPRLALMAAKIKHMIKFRAFYSKNDA